MHSMSPSKRKSQISTNQHIRKKGKCVLLTLVSTDIVVEESVHAPAFLIQKNFKNKGTTFFNISLRTGKQYQLGLLWFK